MLKGNTKTKTKAFCYTVPDISVKREKKFYSENVNPYLAKSLKSHLLFEVKSNGKSERRFDRTSVIIKPKVKIKILAKV